MKKTLALEAKQRLVLFNGWCLDMVSTFIWSSLLDSIDYYDEQMFGAIVVTVLLQV